MVVDERTICYLNSLDEGGSLLCREIAAKASEDRVPIVRRETAAFLTTMVALRRPREVLEIGTAVGYSALRMCEALPAGGKLTTIEKYDRYIREAKANFKRGERERDIRLLEGDAADILKTLAGPYDLIFLDAAKGQYLSFLRELLRLLPVGGVLISDNILQDGELIESRFAVPRRNRTIHARMREYLYELKHNEALATSLLPLGDGVSVSVKIK